MNKPKIGNYLRVQREGLAGPGYKTLHRQTAAACEQRGASEGVCFCRLKKYNLKGLKEALLEKDYGKAFAQAHTLKGVAGNLGFDNVLENLVPLVEILRQTDTAALHVDEIEDYIEKIAVEYTKILKILESMEA